MGELYLLRSMPLLNAKSVLKKRVILPVKANLVLLKRKVHARDVEAVEIANKLFTIQ
jgi:hypothetical protein